MPTCYDLLTLLNRLILSILPLDHKVVITSLCERETLQWALKQMFFPQKHVPFCQFRAQTVAALSLMCHSCRVFACRCISCRAPVEQVWTQTEQIKGVFVNNTKIWHICLFRCRPNVAWSFIRSIFVVLVINGKKSFWNSMLILTAFF